MSTPDTPVRVGDERWKDLATFPSTNAKGAAFIVLALATFLHIVLLSWGITLWQARNPSVPLHVPTMVEALTDAWLIFLAALGGLAVTQFFAKRNTYASPSPDSERAGVPVAPPPAEPSEPVPFVSQSGVVVAPVVARFGTAVSATPPPSSASD